MRDRPSGLALPGPGCVHLDGTAALALVRSRHLEAQAGGQWTVDPRGDLGRVERGQVVLLAALEVLGGTRPDPLTANECADWIVDNVVVDETLDLDAIVDLVGVAFGLEAGGVEMATLPVVPVTLDDGAVMLAEDPEAEEVVGAFAAGEDLASLAASPGLSTCG